MYRMTWTDDRLQERFDAIDRRFDEVDRRFGQVDGRFDKVDAELQALNLRFDAMQRTLMQLGGGMIVALIGLIATQL
jgi:DNA anti-recombination protein RmuC